MRSGNGPVGWAYRGFRALPAPIRGLGDTALRLRAEQEVRRQPTFADEPTRLLIGPLNTAGQAHEWGAAAQRMPGVSALNLAVQDRTGRAGLQFDHDLWLSQAAQLRGLAPWRRRVLGPGGATHGLSESARPVLGDFHRGEIRADLTELAAHGIQVAVVFHGSDLRDPAAHALAHPHSPFAAQDEEMRAYTARLQSLADRGRSAVHGLDVPLFVSTPDLLDDLPSATWLPLVVDVDRIAAQRPVLERAVPVVLHAPSNPRLKGTAAIETVLASLQDDGLVEYRRLTGVPHAQMADFIADVDIVIDQIVLGNPGVLLTESLAAGRVVVAHLTDVVRQRMTDADPQRGLPPVLEATPDTLEDVLREIVRERTSYVDLAAQGPAWARRNHDGTRAASVLAEWLGVSAP